jgi:hypothetical protein
MASLEERAYEIAVRALEQQERGVEALRARTGTLLAAASIAKSFLGAQAIGRHGLSVPTDLALAAFAATVVLGVYVVMPKPAFVFALHGAEILEVLARERDDDREVIRRLTVWIDRTYRVNMVLVDRLSSAFRAAGGALILEIVLLGIGLAVD